MTETVKFNVGGTIYEVSRSLLERYPDTMLAKSASKRWQEDSMSEIFIERDGDLFRHVLSYLRDGRVALPLTASREGLMLELQYYGLDGVEKENIDDSLIRGSQCADIYIDMVQGLKTKIIANQIENSTLKQKTKQNEDEGTALKFSIECIEKWFPEFISIDIKKNRNYKLDCSEFRECPDFVSLCNKHLENFGLVIDHSIADEWNNDTFLIRRIQDKK